MQSPRGIGGRAGAPTDATAQRLLLFGEGSGGRCAEVAVAPLVAASARKMRGGWGRSERSGGGGDGGLEATAARGERRGWKGGGASVSDTKGTPGGGKKGKGSAARHEGWVSGGAVVVPCCVCVSPLGSSATGGWVGACVCVCRHPVGLVCGVTVDFWGIPCLGSAICAGGETTVLLLLVMSAAVSPHKRKMCGNVEKRKVTC